METYNMTELGTNENVQELAQAALSNVTTQMAEAPAVVETVTQQAVEQTGLPGWAKALLLIGGGSILGFLARMGWAKWITPKLQEAAFERKVVKEAKKAAKAAQQAAKQANAAANAPAQAATPAPSSEPKELDPNDVGDIKID